MFSFCGFCKCRHSVRVVSSSLKYVSKRCKQPKYTRGPPFIQKLSQKHGSYKKHPPKIRILDLPLSSNFFLYYGVSHFFSQTYFDSQKKRTLCYSYILSFFNHKTAGWICSTVNFLDIHRTSHSTEWNVVTGEYRDNLSFQNFSPFIFSFLFIFFVMADHSSLPYTNAHVLNVNFKKRELKCLYK